MAQGLLRRSCFKYPNIMKKLPLPLPPPLKNSKSILQFETPRSLVLAHNPLTRFPQKFKSINAPYIEVNIPNLS